MRFIVGLIKDWAIALIAMFALFIIFTMVFSPSAPSLGPASDFELPDLQGREVSLAELGEGGGPVILNFWFTTCPPCRREIPELSAFHAEHPDIPLIGISIDRMSPDRLAKASERLGVTYPVLHDLDGRVARQFGVNVYPTTVIVQDGRVVNSRVGEVNRPMLDSLLRSLP